MAAHFRLEVNQQSKLLYSGELNGPVELGRQKELLPHKSSLEPPFVPRVISPDEKKEDSKDGFAPTTAWSRVPIALRDENRISRRHVLVEPVGNDRVRCQEYQHQQHAAAADGQRCAPGRQRRADRSMLIHGLESDHSRRGRIGPGPAKSRRADDGPWI